MLFINIGAYQQYEQRKQKRVSAAFISKSVLQINISKILQLLEAPQSTQSQITMSSKVLKIQEMNANNPHELFT